MRGYENYGDISTLYVVSPPQKKTFATLFFEVETAAVMQLISS